MGEKKAIIFSTHILEEVDAACTRAIIIDRGRIVANGTPQELRQKSEWAGAVTLCVRGVPAATVTSRLNQLSATKRTTVTKDAGSKVTVTVFPKPNADAELTRAVMDASQGWAVEEMHTEEGRMDEVFRSITMPDTAKEGTK